MRAKPKGAVRRSRHLKFRRLAHLAELVAFLSDQQRLCAALHPWAPSPTELDASFQAAAILGSKLHSSAAERRHGVLAAVRAIRVSEADVLIELRAEGILVTEQSTA